MIREKTGKAETLGCEAKPGNNAYKTIFSIPKNTAVEVSHTIRILTYSL